MCFKQRCGALNQPSGAIHGAVDDAVVHSLPEDAAGTARDRMHDQRVIGFIHIILVQQQPVTSLPSVPPAGRQSRARHVEAIGDVNARERDEH